MPGTSIVLVLSSPHIANGESSCAMVGSYGMVDKQEVPGWYHTMVQYLSHVCMYVCMYATNKVRWLPSTVARDLTASQHSLSQSHLN